MLVTPPWIPGTEGAVDRTSTPSSATPMVAKTRTRISNQWRAKKPGAARSRERAPAGSTAPGGSDLISGSGLVPGVPPPSVVSPASAPALGAIAARWSTTPEPGWSPTISHVPPDAKKSASCLEMASGVSASVDLMVDLVAAGGGASVSWGATLAACSEGGLPPTGQSLKRCLPPLMPQRHVRMPSTHLVMLPSESRGTSTPPLPGGRLPRGGRCPSVLRGSAFDLASSASAIFRASPVPRRVESMPALAIAAACASVRRVVPERSSSSWS